MDKKNKNIVTFIAVVFSLVVCLGIFIMLNNDSNFTVELKEDTLYLSGGMLMDVDIKYDEITSVKKLENIDLGFRKMGIGTSLVGIGHFNNDLFGDYNLYSYSKIKTYIVVLYNDYYYVFNCKSTRATNTLYDELVTKCS